MAASGLQNNATVTDVLREAEKSKSRWVYRMARRALLARGDAASLSRAARDLRSPDHKTQAKALDDLAAGGRAVQPQVPAIVAAAPTLDPQDRWSLVPFALGRIGGEAAGRALADEFATPGYQTAAVVSACERLGPDAQAAAPRLESLAHSQPFRPIRELAVEAYQSVTGKLIEPGPGRCPEAVLHRGSTWWVYAGGHPFRLSTLETDEGGAPAAASGCAPGLPSIRRGNTCLIGVDLGEFGGWVEARSLSTGARQRIESANPLWFFDDGRGGATLLSGIGHMLADVGWVDRLERGAAGRWSAAPVAELDGKPVAYLQSGTALVILTRGFDPGCKSNDYVLVRVAADGRITAYPATRHDSPIK